MQAAALQFRHLSEVSPFWRAPVEGLFHAMAMPTDSAKNPPDHSALIEAIALRRDRAAFGALFDFFAPRVKGFLMRSGMPASIAEDMAQDTLLTVWRKADQFDRKRAAAPAWIFTIARNLRIDSLRREQRAALIGVDPSESPDEPERPDTATLAAERDRRVREAMDELSDEQVRVVELSFFEGRPHGDIARALSLPLGTVKSRLRLAMKQLRERLVDLS
jgi:RNA polymerase sigma-70 factor (ECF subfamily)